MLNMGLSPQFGARPRQEVELSEQSCDSSSAQLGVHPIAQFEVGIIHKRLESKLGQHLFAIFLYRLLGYENR